MLHRDFWQKWLAIGLCILVVTLLTNSIYAEARQQAIPTATPAQIQLPSPLPLMTQDLSTATATRTPTVPGPALLEALNEANVRAQPDPESERLGSIRPGDTYPVLGKYFRWYQFQYDQSPSGTGWVFDELVQIIGDETVIRDLAEEALPTTDNTAVALTGTMESITQTPGGLLTATAIAQFIPLPIEGSTNVPVGTPLDGGGELAFLPTFTYPPDVPAVPPEDSYRAETVFNATPTFAPGSNGFVVTEGFPPIVPILILGGLGILGLLVTTRR
jgi:hypothetical protein